MSNLSNLYKMDIPSNIAICTVSATHAKQNFAAILDLSQREPVRIRRHERDVAVLISADEFESIRKLRAKE